LKLYSETSTNYNGGDDKFMMGNFLLLVIVLDNWKTVVIIIFTFIKKDSNYYEDVIENHTVYKIQ
jgi:hypothetical protein